MLMNSAANRGYRHTLPLKNIIRATVFALLSQKFDSYGIYGCLKVIHYSEMTSYYL
jgi:hypothetical protein